MYSLYSFLSSSSRAQERISYASYAWNVSMIAFTRSSMSSASSSSRNLFMPSVYASKFVTESIFSRSPLIAESRNVSRTACAAFLSASETSSDFSVSDCSSPLSALLSSAEAVVSALLSASAVVPASDDSAFSISVTDASPVLLFSFAHPARLPSIIAAIMPQRIFFICIV